MRTTGEQQLPSVGAKGRVSGGGGCTSVSKVRQVRRSHDMALGRSINQLASMATLHAAVVLVAGAHTLQAAHFLTHALQPPRMHSVVADMRKARIVAGAIVEGDAEDDDAVGNAGEWIALVLMLEEVSREGWGGVGWVGVGVCVGGAPWRKEWGVLWTVIASPYQ